MEAIQVFNNVSFGEVRIAITGDDEPVFCLADLCKILDIKNVSDCKSRLNAKGVVITDTLTAGGIQKIIFINESNFYKVVFQSRKPDAESFMEWVTGDILPSIRKNGIYASPATMERMISDPDFAITLLTSLKNERSEKERIKKQFELQEIVIKDNAPKVEYYEEVLQAKEGITTTIIAKDLVMSAIALNKLLHRHGVIFQVQDTWVLYQKYINCGYTVSKTFTHTDRAGDIRTEIQTYWTEKGRKFIMDGIKNIQGGRKFDEKVKL
jgi:prophage antirepressor-like protein